MVQKLKLSMKRRTIKEFFKKLRTNHYRIVKWEWSFNNRLETWFIPQKEIQYMWKTYWEPIYLSQDNERIYRTFGKDYIYCPDYWNKDLDYIIACPTLEQAKEIINEYKIGNPIGKLTAEVVSMEVF